ncbi:MAG: bifunctional glutamate N-acetyltransferase/amino-acid acetyltransferase ArgJ [Lentisphaerae bacterium]|nr:bifunctional glutamate N-acetyltransferase/amino-acid acetyltransferase ArgJ [Lentisphaerota bacterium]
MHELKEIEGGVTAPRGYRAAGVHAGIKKAAPDMALLVSDKPASAAGVFTTNRVQAAPVILCRDRLRAGAARAVVINSGCANACTGAAGMADAERTAALAARALGLDSGEVLVCSTGTIGKRLPMDRIEAGIGLAAAALAADGGPAAARAIMTTDTRDKQAAVEFEADGARMRVGGMAKGAGMISPDMATMLAFMTADAAVPAGALRACLAAAAARSFNRITVDGDMSTNDTLLCLANGAAGGPELTPRHPAWSRFAEAVDCVAMKLARAVVLDGEGATKFVTVAVRGAASDADAARAARAVANSPLCKTSWFGGDPNWGRVVAALGYSGAEFDPGRVDVTFDEVPSVRGGGPAPQASPEALAAVYARPAFTIAIDLHRGAGADTVYTCDCSLDYVKINADYMT